MGAMSLQGPHLIGIENAVNGMMRRMMIQGLIGKEPDVAFVLDADPSVYYTQRTTGQ